MATIAIQHYLYLLDEAFDDPDWLALLGNLRSIGSEEWARVPANGERSIRDIVGQVGGCKYMYENHGDASLHWEHPLVEGQGVLPEPGSAVHWPRDGQERLRESSAAVDDDQPLVPRRTNWGDWKQTHWIIGVTIQHAMYHAGEINHIRSLLHHSYRCAYSAKS